MYNTADVIAIIEGITGQVVQESDIDDLKNSMKEPETIRELKKYPFKKEYEYLIQDRPPLVNAIIERLLDYGYKGTIIDLTETLNLLEEEEQSNEELEKAYKWLIEKKYGSMRIDW